ncbi:MAG: hypothetical protein KUG77_00925 [Nannocystaceae bacterium]|nr:hypothetical protein [Nannocystaceae bacterium]
MTLTRCSSLAALCLAVSGCFNPEDSPGVDLTDSDTEASGTTDAMTTATESTTNPTSPSTTDDATETPSATDGEVDSDTLDPTGGEACGNGELDGDEVCDDGTNDGTYGSCLEDCSGSAGSCGDGEVSGPEECDDGVNDGSYDGCSDDCTGLGPFCGDAEVNGDEACDDGANLNGGECSTGCVLPGTVVGDHTEGPVSFCDGEFLTRPAFREDGNVLVAATGYCGADSVVLLEVSPEVEVVQDFADLLLPETPVQEGTVVGDNWVLGENGCNYVISSAGALTEVCEARNHGSSALASVDDNTYYALYYDGLARYGVGSPSIGDSPEWEVSEPTGGTFTYSFNAMARGSSNTAVVAGRRTFNSDSLGYIAIYSAGGNLSDEGTTSILTGFSEVASGATGHAAAGSPNDRIIRFGPNLLAQWDVLIPSVDTPSLALDSLGNVVAAYRSSAGGIQVRKLSPDSSVLWTLDLSASFESRVAVDAQDQIWLSSIDAAMGELAFGLRKIAP